MSAVECYTCREVPLNYRESRLFHGGDIEFDDFWRERVTNDGERLKFVLASYNCGAGHVQDAQQLTEKYGGNPQSWDDISYWLLQESTQQYSADPRG